jgi:hypothetical protein
MQLFFSWRQHAWPNEWSNDEWRYAWSNAQQMMNGGDCSRLAINLYYATCTDNDAMAQQNGMNGMPGNNGGYVPQCQTETCLAIMVVMFHLCQTVTATTSR